MKLSQVKEILKADAIVVLIFTKKSRKILAYFEKV